MAMPQWLARIRLLPPRDKEFYHLFIQMADKLIEGSNLLVELVDDEANGDHAHRLAVNMKQLETECDSIVGQTITWLDIAPQPPFDRDDITNLVKYLDDIMDWMERFANRFVMYRTSIDHSGIEQICELAAIVQSSCRKVREAVGCLEHHRREIDDHCITVHALESQADDVHHTALAAGVNRVQERFAHMDGEIAALRSQITANPAGSAEGTLHITEELTELARSTFRFNNLRELLKSLERASDASDTVAMTLKRMVIKNV